MSEFEKLCKDFRMILWISIYVTSIGSLFSFAFGLGKDSTDGKKRSGMALRHDALTGCDYLESSKGALIPRLNDQGYQVCGSSK